MVILQPENADFGTFKSLNHYLFTLFQSGCTNKIKTFFTQSKIDVGVVGYQ